MLGTWAGPELFDAEYDWLQLQEFGMDSYCTPRKHVGSLTLGHSDFREAPVFPLTLHRFLCLLAIVEKIGQAEEESVKERGLSAVAFSGSELSDRISELGEERGLPRDAATLEKKDVSDYFRFINGDLVKRGLPPLISGTPNQGFHLEVYPGNIRFVPAPQLPMNWTRE